MPNIYLNDAVLLIKEECSIEHLLKDQNMNQPHFAVIVNNQLVPRVAYSATQIAAGDKVDIIVPMQGG